MGAFGAPASGTIKTRQMADNFLERQRRDYEERKRLMQQKHPGGKHTTQGVAKRLLRSRDDYAE